MSTPPDSTTSPSSPPPKSGYSLVTRILIGVAVVIVLFVVFVALQPSTFRVQRSMTINAPPEVIFKQVDTLKNWEAWSPWAKLDPTMKMTYEGPPSGEGASYSWVGNGNVGEGRMTIVESKPSTLTRFRLEFFKPFKGTNASEFNFKPEGGQTTVVWSMNGELNFVTKIFHLFMNMDKMVGGQFEQGLTSMKSIVEAQAK
jgi:hypothetical protein